MPVVVHQYLDGLYALVSVQVLAASTCLSDLKFVSLAEMKLVWRGEICGAVVYMHINAFKVDVPV